MRKAFQIGGLVAGAVLIVFGVVAIAMGLNGRHTVSSNLKQEQIVGSSDFTPAAIKAVIAKAGNANKDFPIPSCSIANVAVTNGATARCFAQYMQIDTLNATGGFYFSQMGIYTAKAGAPKAELLPGRRHRQRRLCAGRPYDEAAGPERRAQHLGRGDGTHDRAQHRLHGKPARPVRDRRRLRAPAHRPGLPILAIGGALRKPERQLEVVTDTRTSMAAAPPKPVPTT